MVNSTPVKYFFNDMWKIFINYCPDAEGINDLFYRYGNNDLINDHIALRTFDLKNINIDKISAPFLKQGYSLKDSYVFKEKKLQAKYLQHENLNLPKIFISQLETKKLSKPASSLIHSLCDQVGLHSASTSDLAFCYSGRPWKIEEEIYLTLLKESEYAAWIAAFGFIPNHFTLSINNLTSHNSLQSVNKLLQDNGYFLNKEGGLIKGSPEVFLEQSSTVAKPVPVKFTERTKEIPGCFYEFAKRYKINNDAFYHGFVPESADKIFSSTNTGQRQ